MRIYYIAILLLMGCASIQPLEGGDKDEQIPVVIKTFPDSASINVQSSTFTFEFDEYVKTKNLTQQLLISPIQKTPPKTSIRGKKLTIELTDTLKENTTYIFQFNESIVDINEGNALLNYRYIFSTGSVLDSLTYNATIRDFKTNKPCEECNIQFYSTLQDSVILKDKPSYIGKTNSNGIVSISNLPKDSFLVIAIQDENKNLVLDNGEKISFTSFIETSDRSIKNSFRIFPYIKTHKASLRLVKSSIPSVIKLFSKEPLTELPIVKLNDKEYIISLNKQRDTITVNHKLYTDTINIDVISSDSSSFLKPNTTKKLIRLQSVTNTNKILLKFDRYINIKDSTSLSIILDSISLQKYTINQLDSQNISLNIPNSAYQEIRLIIDSNFVSDVYSNTLQKLDTITLYNPSNTLTNLTLKLDSLNPQSSYILNTFSLGRQVDSRVITPSTQTLNLKLKPGKYQFELITDINKNGIWNTGNPFIKLSPEPISISEEVELRLNWDKELIINPL